MADSRELKELLQRSAGYLKHDDPLLCDLGTHHWLEQERSYSDWLAWVLEQLRDSRAVLRVFGIEDAEWAAACAGEYTVQREVPLLEGLPGCGGQIDLLVRFGKRSTPWCPKALLGIEVKTYDEQYQKQKGYLKSPRRLCPRRAKGILTANDEPEHCFGFSIRKWRDVCLGLRAVVAEGAAQDRFHSATRAMVLAFVSAVEQNLVGFDVASAHRAWNGQPALLPEALSKYLYTAIEEEQRGYRRSTPSRSAAAGR